MKKKIFERVAAAAILCVIVFTGCKKENSNPDQPSVSSTTAGSNDAVTTVYYSCGRALNVFDPLPTTYYSFATQNSANYRYGIEYGSSIVNFQNIDKFSFEFSGLYADVAKSVKMYRIRRTDGKYLTFAFSVDYREKLEGDFSKFQLCIISKIGDNKYNLVLPVPNMSPCNFMRVYYDDFYRAYRIGYIGSDQATYPGTIDIYMLPYITKPPITK